jgi:Na+/glutamate symporter
MNASRIFAVEFFIAVGINSWGALKEGYAPWPPVIVTSAIAMAILSMSSAIDERLAVALGTGFLVASIISVATSQGGSTSGAAGKWSGTFGALPQNVQYDVLKLNSAGSTDASQ